MTTICLLARSHTFWLALYNHNIPGAFFYLGWIIDPLVEMTLGSGRCLVFMVGLNGLKGVSTVGLKGLMGIGMNWGGTGAREPNLWGMLIWGRLAWLDGRGVPKNTFFGGWNWFWGLLNAIWGLNWLWGWKGFKNLGGEFAVGWLFGNWSGWKLRKTSV